MNYLTATILAAVVGLGLFMACGSGVKTDTRKTLESRTSQIDQATALLNSRP